MERRKLARVILYNMKTKRMFEYDLEDHKHLSILTHY